MQTQTRPPSRPSPRQRRTWLVGVAVIAGVAIVGLGIWGVLELTRQSDLEVATELVDDWNQGWNDDDVDAVVAVFAEDADFSDPTQAVEGVDGVRAYTEHWIGDVSAVERVGEGIEADDGSFVFAEEFSVLGGGRWEGEIAITLESDRISRLEWLWWGEATDEAAIVPSAIQEELETPGPGREPVEFAIVAPDADQVTLEMTANQWGAEPIVLPKVDDERGTHAVTLHLGEDEWLYRFEVDGVWTVDEANPLRVAAEDGQENSLVRVGDTLPGVSERPGVPAGIVETISLASDAVGADLPLVVYTPPGYSEAETYPLLVMLHGYAVPASTWIEAAGVDHAMDNLLAEGEIVPFVVAMPTTERSVYDDAYVDHVLDEVLPYLDETYSLERGPGSTAITGASMGGHGAVELVYRRQERFGLMMPLQMAGPSGLFVAPDVAAFEAAYPDGFDLEVAMWVGANDELGFVQNHEVFSDYLDGLGVAHQHHVDEVDGHFQDGHSMRYIRTILPDVLRRASEFFEG